jgi:hypothetical protein
MIIIKSYTQNFGQPVSFAKKTEFQKVFFLTNTLFYPKLVPTQGETQMQLPENGLQCIIRAKISNRWYLIYFTASRSPYQGAKDDLPLCFKKECQRVIDSGTDPLPIIEIRIIRLVFESNREVAKAIDSFPYATRIVRERLRVNESACPEHAAELLFLRLSQLHFNS